MNEKILVIEDNEEHRFILKEMLIDEGYEVETANNRNEVNQKMEKSGKSFDLLMVDLAVPGFERDDSIEFIKTYKEKNRILVVSAYMDKYPLSGILEERWKIKKPFDNNVLIERVKERLALPIVEDKE